MNINDFKKKWRTRIVEAGLFGECLDLELMSDMQSIVSNDIREECAKICDDLVKSMSKRGTERLAFYEGPAFGSEKCADAIRLSKKG